MATPFPFGSGNVLTAAQLNAVTTLPVSTKTASYVLTVADLGTRVVMNSASATTITVNTSIFGASDKVEILNIGAGVCTVTVGTCTVGTTGTLALAQNAGGTLTFISASASVFVASGVAAASGALTLVSTGTFTTVASVSTGTIFSATYDNYLVLIYGAGSTAANVGFRFNASGSAITTGYYGGLFSIGDGGTGVNTGTGNQTSLTIGRVSDSPYLDFNFEYTIYDANNSNHYPSMSGTGRSGSTTQSQEANFFGGSRLTKQVVDGFSLLVSAGTFTGKYKVFGYGNS